jgi:outer membrane protein
MGIDPTEPVDAVDPPEGEVEEEITEYSLEQALARRPDIMAWEETVTAAGRSLLASKAGRWPDLGLSVSYSRSEDDLGALFDGMTDDYTRSVSLSLGLPIFNGLATKASIDNSKSTLRNYELSLRNAKLIAAFEIETARLLMMEQKGTVEVAETSVAQAEEDLRVSEERFRLRAASMLDLIDARVAYSRAKALLVDARYDYEIAKADLKRALGL